MKKVNYLMTVLFAVALLSTSCCKEDPIVPDTLETQYPEWANLTWVSTDGNDDDELASPQLSIVIINNVVHLTEIKYFSAPINDFKAFPMEYGGITLTSTTIEFNDPDINTGAIVREYQILTPPDDFNVKISYDSHTYVLYKN